MGPETGLETRVLKAWVQGGQVGRVNSLRFMIGLRVLTLLSKSSLISKTVWREADPALQDDCATGSGCYHINLSLTFTPALLL